MEAHKADLKTEGVDLDDILGCDALTRENVANKSVALVTIRPLVHAIECDKGRYSQDFRVLEDKACMEEEQMETIWEEALAEVGTEDLIMEVVGEEVVEQSLERTLSQQSVLIGIGMTAIESSENASIVVSNEYHSPINTYMDYSK